MGRFSALLSLPQMMGGRGNPVLRRADWMTILRPLLPSSAAFGAAPWVCAIPVSEERGASNVFRSLVPAVRGCVPRGRCAGTAVLAGLWLLTAAGCGGMVAQSRNAQGVRLFEQSRHQEALQQFEQAIISDPNGADGYYNLAAVYHRLGSLNNDRSL